jgi:hypothetical protein
VVRAFLWVFSLRGGQCSHLPKIDRGRPHSTVPGILQHNHASLSPRPESDVTPCVTRSSYDMPGRYCAFCLRQQVTVRRAKSDRMHPRTGEKGDLSLQNQSQGVTTRDQNQDITGRPRHAIRIVIVRLSTVTASQAIIPTSVRESVILG